MKVLVDALRVRVGRHAGSAAWSTAEYVAYPLLMIAAAPLLVAGLGTEGYGLLMLVSAVAGIGVAANFGMGAATVKFVSAAVGRGNLAEAGRVIRTTLVMSVVTSLIVVLAISLAVPWLARHVFERMGPTPLVESALWCAAAILLFSQTDGVLSAALKGRERFDLAAKLEIGAKLLLVGGSLLAALLSRDLVVVLEATAALAATAAVVKALAVSHLFGAGALWRWGIDRETVKAVLGFGLWNWILGLSALLFLHADRMLVGSLLGASALAYYSVCVQLAQQIHAVPAAAMSFLFPLMSRKIEQGGQGAGLRVRDGGVALNVALSVVLGAAMLLWGRDLLGLWMGAEFARNGGEILNWLIAAFFLLSLNVAPHYLLLGRNEARFVSITNIAGGVLGLVAAFALTPFAGLLGTAQARIALGTMILVNYWKLFNLKAAH